MPDGYSWNYARSESSNRLPGPEHLGWWAAAAIVLSLVLHVLVFMALDRLEVALSFHQARELRTGRINVTRVEVRPQDEPARLAPEEVVTPPNDVAQLLDEVDLLAALPQNEEIDMRPDLSEAAYALQMQNPARQGETEKMDMTAPGELAMDAEMPEIAADPQLLKPAEIGQVAVDPGARIGDRALDDLTDDLADAGATVAEGAPDGVESLDSLLELPPNLLLSKKTMLPSDLLFEFNRAELRESAKIGLMKLALLMDRNPQLYCWIEGHTDLIGGEASNLRLSMQRAEAVKSYLVDSLRIDGERIITRGFGESQPLITTGDADAQAPNRRVEIRMRKTPPEEAPAGDPAGKAPVETRSEPVLVRPPQAVPQPAPRAVLVRPKRALPVELPGEVPKAEPVIPEGVPRAGVVVEPPAQ